MGMKPLTPLEIGIDMLMDMLSDIDMDMDIPPRARSNPNGVVKPNASLDRCASVLTVNLFRSREADATPEARNKYDTDNFILSLSFFYKIEIIYSTIVLQLFFFRVFYGKYELVVMDWLSSFVTVTMN